MKHVVIVTCPDQKPRQYVLKGKRIGLGRGEENDICLDVDAISSSHIEFGKTEGGYELKDLDSTNGTRVNGKKVKGVPLEDGDRILIGETVPAHFLLLAEDETWEAAAAEDSEEDQKVAGDFVTMSDRLEKLEAHIEEKQEEAATIEAQLVELRATHQQRLTEFAEAQLALDALQREIDEKKHQGTASATEMQQLEDSLLENTQKVKLMSSHLASQQQQISQLEQLGPVEPRQNPHARPAEQAPTPAPQKVPPAKKTVPPGGGNQGSSKTLPGQRTIPLTKQGGPITRSNLPPAPQIMKRKQRP